VLALLSLLQGDLLPVEDYEDVVQLKSLIQRHLKFTGSETARRILLGWDRERLHFKKVFPHEYRRALQEAAAIKKAEEEQKAAIKAAGARRSLPLHIYMTAVCCVC
jgi:glutamate synthase (NADPH/NADH)